MSHPQTVVEDRGTVRAATGIGYSRATDALLLRRVSDGDLDALGALYDRHAAAAYALAARMCGASVAEEVLERTFTTVWRAAGGEPVGEGSARAWILELARGTALALIRDSLPPPAAAASARAAAARPSAPSAAAEAAGVRSVLQALAPHDRLLIELACFDDLDAVQIAAGLAVSPNAVKRRLNLALKEIDRRLTAMFVEAGSG